MLAAYEEQPQKQKGTASSDSTQVELEKKTDIDQGPNGNKQ